MKLELASSGTFISKMNFDVLKREYTKLLSDIVSYKESYQALLDDITRPTESELVLDTVKEVVQAKKEEVKKTNSDNTGRRQTLLEQLKEKGPSSVGELVGAFSEPISGKTVQRELNAMVISGDIKKEGEKRWRRYFI